jgi:actin-like ATPase involved in cell morphogenesis
MCYPHPVDGSLRPASTLAGVTAPSGFRLGIDFGTTHTVAALARPDGRVQSLLFASSPLLPSAIFAEPGGHLLTGQDAVRSARLDPTRYEPNVKRRIDEGTILLGTDEYPVVDLIAAVLRRVYDEAVRVAGGLPAQSVLTYPAGWAETRRGVLADAATRAGMGAVVLVPEPLAAAAYFSSAFAQPVPPGSALVVYDFGAGTFDVSVIGRQPDGGWQVVANEGLDDVGGLDLDAAIVEQIRTRLGATDPVRWQQLVDAGTADGRRGLWLLLDEARAAKEQLSRTSLAAVRVPGFEADAHVTREEFEALARPWLERTVALTAATLFRTGMRRDQVAAVLLVGGSSRIPLVATMLHQRLGIAPTVLDQPELVVAEGSLAQAPTPVSGPPPLPVSGLPPASAPPPLPVSAPPIWPGYAGPPAPVSAPPPMYPADVSWPGAAVPVAAPPVRRAGRLWRWTLAGAVAVIALTAGTVALVNMANSGHGTNSGNQNGITANLPQGSLATPSLATGPRSTPPRTGRSASPSASPSAGGVHVIYEVTASGSNNIGDVTYTDEDNQIIRKHGIPLPWRIEFTSTQQHPSLILEGQRKGGGDNGPVNCRVTANGKVLAETTATGQYAAVSCVG